MLVYGPGQKGNMAALMRLARAPYPLPLGGLSGRRSLVSVDSLSDAVETVLTAPGTLRRPLIVAEAEPLRVPEMIASLRAGLDRRPGLVPVPQALVDAALALTGRSELRERLAGSLVARRPAWRPWAGRRRSRPAKASHPWPGPAADRRASVRPLSIVPSRKRPSARSSAGPDEHRRGPRRSRDQSSASSSSGWRMP